MDRGKTNAEAIKQLEKDFGLSRHRIYDLMSDEYKRDYEKADANIKGTPKDDESKSPQSGQSSQVVDSVFKGKEPDVQEVMVAELRKVGIELEAKVPFKRPYSYTRSYFVVLRNPVSLVYFRSLRTP